jgi:hypothetical protein
MAATISTTSGSSSSSSRDANPNPARDVNAYVKKTRELIQQEQDEEMTEEQLFKSKLSAKELEERGVCLSKLVVAETRTGLYGRCMLTLESSRGDGTLPASRFAVRDVVQIQGGMFRKSKLAGKAGDDGKTSSIPSSGSGVRTRSKADEDESTGVVYRITDRTIIISLERQPPQSLLSGQVSILRLSNTM